MTLDANLALVVQDQKDLKNEARRVKKESLEQTSLDNCITDYDYIRKNIKELIDKGMDILEGASNIANESESPRAFEVAAAALKNIMELNLSLQKLNQDALTISENIIIVEEHTPELIEHNQSVNNLFIGTTQSLSELLESMKK